MLSASLPVDIRLSLEMFVCIPTSFIDRRVDGGGDGIGFGEGECMLSIECSAFRMDGRRNG